jgi:2-polyprenyl-3-methyl-5-hydroxy-6-metoxy-1,4-benzoquinol methylase
MTDRSNGYERISEEFLSGRGRAPVTGIGARVVLEWARKLPQGATVLDLGCGSGLPITRSLVDAGLNVYAIDAAPSMVKAFLSNYPNIPVACEAVEDSLFFNRKFDAVCSWGLIFLLPAGEQRRLIHRLGEIIVPGGRLLFTSPVEEMTWIDAMTELETRSIGRDEYLRCLESAGFALVGEYEDEGENHHYDAIKRAFSTDDTESRTLANR